MLQDTSLANYENEVRPKLGEKQAAVRRLLLAYPEGLTNAEIGQLLGWTINRVTPRTGELVQMRAAKDAGRRPCRVTGNMAHVWKLTQPPAPKVAEAEHKPASLF